MNLHAIKPISSFSEDHSHFVLCDIFSEQISVASWQRKPEAVVEQYFEQIFDRLGLGVNRVFEVASMKESLSYILPDGEGKQQAIDDIHLVSDMLTTLFDCDSVGLRLVPLPKAMCPNFHVDKIPVRLVTTYLGPATEWLPVEALKPRALYQNDDNLQKSGKFYYRNEDVKQLNRFDVALLKGAAWEKQEHMAAIHRSCAVENNQKRVLLTLDPM